MTFFDLKIIISVANELSFTKTAKALFISQSAVSQSVARLEKELNILLFNRHNSIITPTEACHHFIGYAEKILALENELITEMNTFSVSQRNQIRVGTVSFFVKYLSRLEDTTSLESKRDTNISIIENHADVIETMTVEGKLDFCFTRLPMQQKQLQYEHLFSERILLAVPRSHSICAKYKDYDNTTIYPTVRLSEFSTDQFAMINNPRVTPICLSMCAEASFKPNIAYNTYTWEHILAYIQSGLAVGFISYLHAKENDNIMFFQIDSKLSQLEHVAAYISKKNLSKTSVDFIAKIRDKMEQLHP